jgi:hypothetical protein
MPETPEEKKNAWKYVLSQIKAFGVVFISAVTIVGGGMWYLVENYLDDYIDDKVEIALEERQGKKSFREILGEQMKIPSDIVPYHITEKFTELDSLISEVERFEKKYIGFLDFHMKITPLYRFLDENGIEWWNGPDGRPHGVLFDNGEAWVAYSNKKLVIGKAY